MSPKDELDARLDRLEHDLAGNFTVMSSLAAITAQTAVSLRRIENRDPDLAAYLRAIDHPIEVIGRASSPRSPSWPPKKGIAGQSQCRRHERRGRGASSPGRPRAAHAAVSVVYRFDDLRHRGGVPPCDTAELADGYRHLACRVHAYPWWDRELLIRHLLRRQSNQLREDRGGATGMSAPTRQH